MTTNLHTLITAGIVNPWGVEVKDRSYVSAARRLGHEALAVEYGCMDGGVVTGSWVRCAGTVKDAVRLGESPDFVKRVAGDIYTFFVSNIAAARIQTGRILPT